MNLESQVASLELSKQLKTLGFFKNSLWHWGWYEPSDRWDVINQGETDNWEYPKGTYSAFTVAELGEMLPETFDDFKHELYMFKQQDDYFLCYRDKRGWHHSEAEDKTEANARAKMLIHLIEKGVVKP